MMRYQRVSPDYHPVSNGAGATGRKPSLRTCKEEEIENVRIGIPTTFDSKSLRPSRTPSVSTSAAAAGHPNISHSSSPCSSLQGELTAAIPSVTGHWTPNGHHEPSIPIGGDVVLQWGHNKRLRGSRAMASSSPALEDSPAHSRQVIRIHRRSATEKLAAAVMPPPPPAPALAPALASCRSYTRGAPAVCSSYTRSGGNIRPSTPLRDSTGPHLRSADERAYPSEKEKAHKIVSNNRGDNSSHHNQQQDSKLASDHDTLRSWSGAAAEKLNLEQFEWPRIYISLSRKEKEDDFLAMKGTKLPQRPKKRAKAIDKLLQYCFPGMWLSDLTRGRYEVREKKCVKRQKARGLKGMESMDSESE